jgi:hypothetical protein
MAGWNQMGKLLLLLGVGLALLGGALILGSKVLQGTKIPWLGRLPGDIRIQRGGFSCYFPLATSIIVSLLLTVVLNVIVRLLKR